MTNPFTDFDADDEDRLVRDSARRLMQESRRPVVIGGRVVPPGQHSTAYAHQIESLGLSELVAAAGAVDVAAVRRIAILSEEAGANLFTTPIAESIGLSLLQSAGLTRESEAQHKDLVLMALGSMLCPEEPLPVIVRDDSGVSRLSGRIKRVPFAPLAGHFLVHATSERSPVLVLAPATGTGVSLESESMVDGTLRGEVDFDGCSVQPAVEIAVGEDARRGADLLADVLLLSTAAQLAGIAARVQEVACEHIRTRHQFGRPLAAFQALQHRAANDYSAVTVARAFLYQLCDFWDEDRQRRGLLHALLVKSAQTAIDVAKSAIHMHGAMGFTAEHEVGWYLKAAITLSTRYGDPAMHRRRFAEHRIEYW